MIRSDPDWKQGNYIEGEEPFRGMALARKIGLLSYRADDEWNSKFDRSLIEQNKLTGDPFEHRFEIERYLEYNANKFIHSFDPNSYQYLSQAMDMFNLPDHGGTLQAAMSRIKVEVAGHRCDYRYAFPLASAGRNCCGDAKRRA